MIKEAQPNKIYTEQFLYLNTDVHIFVTCHALFSEEVDRSLCISPINLPLFHEICKNSWKRLVWTKALSELRIMFEILTT